MADDEEVILNKMDPKQVNRGVNLATGALFMAACGYIVALFQAVPISMNFQVSGTSLPSSVSVTHLTAGLAVFRLFTFLCGNMLGVATDMCGRKPWLAAALFCYIPVYAVLAGVWYARPDWYQAVPSGLNETLYPSTKGQTSMLVPCNDVAGSKFNFSELDWADKHDCEWQPQIAWYYVAYVILGILTPYQPHAVGYVSDISPRRDLPFNQSWLGAFGYYLGLFAGFVIALAVYVVAGGLRENQEEGFKGTFIPVSFFVAIVICIAGLVIVYRMDESKPRANRPKTMNYIDASPCIGCWRIGFKNKYFLCVMGYFFWMSFGGGANEAMAVLLFQRWYVASLGERSTLMMFLVYAIVSYLLNFLGAAITTSCYIRKCGFKNSFHIIFILGIPTVLVMIFGLGQPNPSLGLLLVIWIVSITSTGPVVPFIATLFMGQTVSDEEKGLYSGMFRSTEAFGKACGAAIVGTAIAPGWVQEWRDTEDLKGADYHPSYWVIPFMGYFVPLFLSYFCFLVGEGCFVQDDKRGWEDKNAIQEGAQLYINCCTPGGCLTYQKGRAEKLAEKRARASSIEMQKASVEQKA